MQHVALQCAVLALVLCFGSCFVDAFIEYIHVYMYP